MSVLFTYSLILLGSFLSIFSQQLPEKGVPLLQNFSPGEYDHKGKIWAIDTAPNGVVYMAADKGLLEYDGKNWESFRGSEGVIRSILVSNDSLIYTGSDLDFGVWKRTVYNHFEYESLYPFKEELSEINEEFWGVHSLDDNIFFVSRSNVYIYKNENLTKIPAPNEIINSFIVDETLYFVDKEEGVFQLRDLSLKNLFRFNDGKPLNIVGMYKGQTGLILVTQSSGLFEYSSGQIRPVFNQLSKILGTSTVFSFQKINDSFLAFGSILDGVYVSDLEGNILHHINKNKGLQNNTVLSLNYSSYGKLWLSMDYGVSYLDLGNDFTFFFDYKGEFGTGYTALLKNNTFYLGTNQGLYTSSWKDLNNNSDINEFKLVKGTEGQVWTLDLVEDQILMGHDEGLFKIDGDRNELISNKSGIWTLQRYKEYLLAGTYNGISIFKKDGNSWKYVRQMELILGSSNQVLIEGENTLWVNIPNFGVIKSKLTEELYPEDREIFLSQEFNTTDHFLRQDKDGVHVYTDSYKFEFDLDKKNFKSTVLNGVKMDIDDLLLRNSKPIELNSNYEFYQLYNGFALKNLKPRNKLQDTSSIQLLFRKFIAFNNERRVEVYDSGEIPYQLNNIRIDGLIPNQNEVQYQYAFDGSDSWSKWSQSSTIEWVGVSHGWHTISVRAKVKGVDTPIFTIGFHVTTPWYLSWYAYLFYFLLVVILSYFFYLWLTVSLKRQKRYLLNDQRNSLHDQKVYYKQQLKRIEEDKLHAENEELKTRLKSKTIELTIKAKENDEKNKILETIKEKFEKIEKSPEAFKHKSSEIKQIIESHINEENNTFEIQIDELHQEFFQTLRNQFPDLTRYDLRLCAYIKIGFDSKEISDFLNIKPSSIYISRSRLRKKLNIETDDDLHSFLNSI